MGCSTTAHHGTLRLCKGGTRKGGNMVFTRWNMVKPSGWSWDRVFDFGHELRQKTIFETNLFVGRQFSLANSLWTPTHTRFNSKAEFSRERISAEKRTHRVIINPCMVNAFVNALSMHCIGHRLHWQDLTRQGTLWRLECCCALSWQSPGMASHDGSNSTWHMWPPWRRRVQEG